MAGIPEVVATLKREEAKLVKQLTGIKDAISSLEFGSGGGAPKLGVIVRRVRRGLRRPRKFVAAPKALRKRTVSAAQRRAQSLKMKAYWAKKKSGAKK